MSIKEPQFISGHWRAGLLALGGGLFLGVTPGWAEPTVYGSVVAPILQSKCFSCHGEKKQKGKLAMHTYELMLKGGDSGEILVPGKAAESEMISRISLPEDDDDHMPPEGKDQLSKEEIEVLKWWIDGGAKAETPVVADEAPEGIRALVEKLAKEHPDGVVAGAEPEDTGPVVPPPTPEQEAAIAKLQEELRIVILPVSQDNPGLTFTAVNVAKDFDDAMLAQFEPIAPNLLHANLARTKVTDGGLATVAKMKNLTRLRLERTEITDAGLDHLGGLEHLEYLNLYGTKVTDAGLTKLSGLANLQKLYLWETGVTEEGAKKLAEALPEVLINLGWDKEVGNKPVIARIPAPEPEAPAEPDKDTVYGALIHPVLQAKCTGCHGTEKQKGKLAMHTFEALMKGGESEKTIVPKNSAESELARRIGLPADDDDHMPPKDKDQLSEREIALIKWWIDSGAEEAAKVAETQVPANLLLLQ